MKSKNATYHSVYIYNNALNAELHECTVDRRQGNKTMKSRNAT